MSGEYKEKALIPVNQASVFVKRKLTFTLIFLGVLALFSLSAAATDYDFAGGFESMPKAAVWMAENFIPIEKAWPRLPNILTKLAETALVSVAVTVCGAICAFFLQLARHKDHEGQPMACAGGQNYRRVFQERARCGLGNASAVFFRAKYSHGLLRPVLRDIRNVDPDVYRNHR
jgi:hypothetical protein